MKLRKITVALCAAIVIAVPVWPQAAPRVTYSASVSGQATTADVLLSIEAPAGSGFKLVGWCVGTTSATAAAGITVTVRRTTTASSAGTALTAEGTGTTSVSKLDPGFANFGGVARLGGTPGTAGATLDQQGFMAGEIGAGTADHPGILPFCKTYGLGGENYPTVVAGVTNGLSINLSAAGAGGLAFGSIAALFVVE